MKRLVIALAAGLGLAACGGAQSAAPARVPVMVLAGTPLKAVFTTLKLHRHRRQGGAATAPQAYRLAGSAAAAVPAPVGAG
jgi:hypothetical protein